jgi:CheY-like chemotaxis protein
MGTPKILVIEDSEATQQTLRVLFSELGCEVTAVSSGEEALEKLDHNLNPNLIILDLKLPGMSGIEFYRGIALNAKWKGTPVIPFTSQWNDQWGPQDKKLQVELLSTNFALTKILGKNAGMIGAISKGAQGESVSTVPQELILSVGSALIRGGSALPKNFKEALDYLLDKRNNPPNPPD